MLVLVCKVLWLETQVPKEHISPMRPSQALELASDVFLGDGAGILLVWISSCYKKKVSKLEQPGVHKLLGMAHNLS